MNVEEELGTDPQSGRMFGFTRYDRLLQRRQFTDLAKKGRKIQNRHFVAYVQRNKLSHSRLGITVTRKVGHAANRNRIKRLAREFFRLHRQILSLNWDINLIAKIEASNTTNKVIVTSLENLFSRIATIEN